MSPRFSASLITRKLTLKASRATCMTSGVRIRSKSTLSTTNVSICFPSHTETVPRRYRLRIEKGLVDRVRRIRQVTPTKTPFHSDNPIGVFHGIGRQEPIRPRRDPLHNHYGSLGSGHRHLWSALPFYIAAPSLLRRTRRGWSAVCYCRIPVLVVQKIRVHYLRGTQSAHRRGSVGVRWPRSPS